MFNFDISNFIIIDVMRVTNNSWKLYAFSSYPQNA